MQLKLYKNKFKYTTKSTTKYVLTKKRIFKIIKITFIDKSTGIG